MYLTEGRDSQPTRKTAPACYRKDAMATRTRSPIRPKMRTTPKPLLVGALAACVASVLAGGGPPTTLSVEFDAEGRVTLSTPTIDVPLIAAAAPDLTTLDVWNGTGVEPLGKIDYAYATHVVSTHWDVGARVRTVQYGWGTIAVG